MFVPLRAPFRVSQLSSTCLDPGVDVTPYAQKSKKGGLSRSSLSLVLSSNQSCPPGFTYCPEVLVAAVAAPAVFGVDK
jgi:hypothetical protein